MHVRKRIFTFLFAALVMALLTACGKWDYSREAVKAANDAQGQTLRVEFKVNQTFTNALRAAAEDNIQPADVDKAMTMDKSIEKLLTSGYRLDVYALRADIDADKAAAQLAGEFVNRLAGCEDEGYIGMVKADNSYFYMAVLTYKAGSGGASDGDLSDDGEAANPGPWVEVNEAYELHILKGAGDKFGSTLTEQFVKDALTAQGEEEKAETFSMYDVTKLEIDGNSHVTVIGDYAFLNGESDTLKSVSLAGVKTLGDNVFQMCNALSEVTETDQLTTVGTYAFHGTAIEEISLPSVTSIGNGVFAECSNLETVSIPKVTEIQEQTFAGCSSLNSITMPNVTLYGKQAFTSCAQLDETDFHLGTITKIGEAAFQMTAVSNIAGLHSAITTIEPYTFTTMPQLKAVDLSDSAVKNIQEGAFNYCSALEYIRLPDDLESIGGSVFSNAGPSNGKIKIYYKYGESSKADLGKLCTGGSLESLGLTEGKYELKAASDYEKDTASLINTAMWQGLKQ